MGLLCQVELAQVAAAAAEEQKRNGRGSQWRRRVRMRGCEGWFRVEDEGGDVDLE